jgi:Bacterial extracellular solute-binding proteins, family 3
MIPTTRTCRREWLAITLGGACLGRADARKPLPTEVPLLVGDGLRSDETLRLLKWFAARLDVDWDMRPTPWLRAQQQAAAGEGLMYGLSRSPERERLLRFSLPVWRYHTWAVVRQEDKPRIRHAADLRGMAMCWTRGSNYEGLARRADLDLSQVQETTSDEGGLRMVAAGRCRAMLLTMETDQIQRAERILAPAALRRQGLALVSRPLNAVSVHFAAAHQSRWAPVMDRIDTLISSSRASLERLQQPQISEAGAAG